MLERRQCALRPRRGVGLRRRREIDLEVLDAAGKILARLQHRDAPERVMPVSLVGVRFRVLHHRQLACLRRALEREEEAGERVPAPQLPRIHLDRLAVLGFRPGGLLGLLPDGAPGEVSADRVEPEDLVGLLACDVLVPARDGRHLQVKSHQVGTRFYVRRIERHGPRRRPGTSSRTTTARRRRRTGPSCRTRGRATSARARPQATRRQPSRLRRRRRRGRLSAARP